MRFGSWLFKLEPLGGYRLPMFQASARGLEMLFVCVVTVCRSGGGRTPSSRRTLREAMCS